MLLAITSDFTTIAVFNFKLLLCSWGYLGQIPVVDRSLLNSSQLTWTGAKVLYFSHSFIIILFVLKYLFFFFIVRMWLALWASWKMIVLLQVIISRSSWCSHFSSFSSSFWSIGFLLSFVQGFPFLPPFCFPCFISCASSKVFLILHILVPGCIFFIKGFLDTFYSMMCR